MKIGIASYITIKDLIPFLDAESAKEASLVQNIDAPAVTALVVELLRLGHKVTVFTLLASGVKSPTVFTGENVKIYADTYESKGLTRYFACFYKKIIKLRILMKMDNMDFDILNVHWTYHYAIASMKYQKKIPIIITVRDIAPVILRMNFKIKRYCIFYNYLLNELVLRNKKVSFMTNSKYTQDMVKKYWNKATDYVLNPITIPISDNRKKKYSEVFNIISISISMPDDKRKNVLNLIDAFQLFHSEFPKSTLTLIGPFFVKDNSVIKKLERKGLLAGVSLKGQVIHSELIKFFREADVLMHPSLEETFGNTLLEAMSCHCPVIGGRNSGAVPYVLENGRAGLLCDVSSSTGIYLALKEVYLNPIAANERADYAVKMLKTKYNKTEIAMSYINLYKKAVKKFN